MRGPPLLEDGDKGMHIRPCNFKPNEKRCKWEPLPTERWLLQRPQVSKVVQALLGIGAFLYLCIAFATGSILRRLSWIVKWSFVCLLFKGIYGLLAVVLANLDEVHGQSPKFPSWFRKAQARTSWCFSLLSGSTLTSI